MSVGEVRKLLESFGEGFSMFVQGAAAESQAFCDFLTEHGGGIRAPRMFSSLVPGLNGFDYTAAIPGAQMTTLLLPPALHDGFTAGRIRTWPVSYYGAAHALSGGTPFDVVVGHACPPDEKGLCSLGVTADFLPLLWPRAKKRILVINPDMPCIAGAATVPYAEADAVLEAAGAVRTIDAVAGDAGTARIASHVANMIGDGAALQIGIGTVPDLVMAELRARRDLLIHSGSVGDGLIGLAESGALRPGRVQRVGALVSSAALHQFAAENDVLNVVDTMRTHAPPLFPHLPGFVSVNSALDVDLFGQVNLEWRKGQLVSGVGGAPDFVLGAQLSTGGRSIIALQSTAARGTISRIVPRLDVPTVSIPRNLVDTIVTEHGVAELRGRSVEERAQAMMAIAAPEFRGTLEQSWSALRAQM